MHARWISSGEGQVEQVMASQVRYLLTGADTEGRLTMVEIRDVPGGGVPPHVHSREDEIFQVMEGEVEFLADGRTFVAGPGSVVFAPRGQVHSFTPRTPCRLIVSMTPAGIEDMFHALAALPPTAGPPDIVAVCARHGIEFR